MPRIFGTSLTSYLPPAVLWLLALGFLLMAETFDVQSRMMPLLVGRAMLVLATLDLAARTQTQLGRTLLRWFNPAALAQEGASEHPSTVRAEFLHILWIAGFVAAVIWLGMLVSTPLFLLISLVLRGKRTIIESIFVTFVVCAFIWVLFTLTLNLHLFPGLLFGGEW